MTNKVIEVSNLTKSSAVSQLSTISHLMLKKEKYLGFLAPMEQEKQLQCRCYAE